MAPTGISRDMGAYKNDNDDEIVQLLPFSSNKAVKGSSCVLRLLVVSYDTLKAQWN